MPTSHAVHNVLIVNGVPDSVRYLHTIASKLSFFGNKDTTIYVLEEDVKKHPSLRNVETVVLSYEERS